MKRSVGWFLTVLFCTLPFLAGLLAGCGGSSGPVETKAYTVPEGAPKVGKGATKAAEK